MADVWEAVARWARTFKGAYVLSVVGVLAATAASLTGRWWVLLVGFVVLGLVVSRLGEVVRLEGDDGRRRRVVVAVAQLVVGATVVVLAWTGSFGGADSAFLLGLALAIMATGALVGELRGLPGPEPVRQSTIVVAGLVGLLVVACWSRPRDHRHQVAPLDAIFDDRRQVPQCDPSNGTSCTTQGYAWHLDQLRESYWTAVVVLTLALIGA